jgi:hypothetical protein
MKKKVISLVMALVMCMTLSIQVLAVNSDPTNSISEEDVISAIEDGSAVVTTEVRDASTYSSKEVYEDAGLQELFSKVGNSARNILRSNLAHSYRAVGNVYTTTVQMTSGDIVVYRLYPYADLDVIDVGNAGSSGITTELHVSESVTVNGTVNEWENYIRLKNISGSFGCGANTVFFDQVEGVGNIASFPTSSILSLISQLADAAGYTTTSQILSAFSLISFNNQNYVSNQSIAPNTRAVGLKWGSSIVVKDSNEYLKARSTILTKDSSGTANLVTYAAGQWVFDIYYGAGSLYAQYSGVTLRPNGTYKSNVR